MHPMRHTRRRPPVLQLYRITERRPRNRPLADRFRESRVCAREGADGKAGLSFFKRVCGYQQPTESPDILVLPPTNDSTDVI